MAPDPAEAALADAALGELGINTAGMSAADLVASGAGASLPTGFGLSTLGLSPEALAFQGAGMGIKALATADANRRRQNIIDAMGQYRSGLGKQIASLDSKYVDDSSPAARAANMTAAVDANRAGLQTTVGAAQALENTGDPAGKLSDAYRAAQGASADTISQRTKALIENLARMRAPGVVQQQAGIRFGRAAGDQAGLTMASNNAAAAGQTDLAGVQENPWANLGGDVLEGVGAGLQMKNALKSARGAL